MYYLRIIRATLLFNILCAYYQGYRATRLFNVLCVLLVLHFSSMYYLHIIRATLLFNKLFAYYQGYTSLQCTICILSGLHFSSMYYLRITRVYKTNKCSMYVSSVSALLCNVLFRCHLCIHCYSMHLFASYQSLLMLVPCKELLLKSLIDQVLQTFEVQIVIVNNFHPIGLSYILDAHLSNNNMYFG